MVATSAIRAGTKAARGAAGATRATARAPRRTAAGAGRAPRRTTTTRPAPATDPMATAGMFVGAAVGALRFVRRPVRNTLRLARLGRRRGRGGAKEERPGRRRWRWLITGSASPLVALILLVAAVAAALPDEDQVVRATVGAVVDKVGGALGLNGGSGGSGGSASFGTIPASSGIPYHDLFNGTASLGIDPLLVAAVAWQESRYDTCARSDAGAVGIMQLMPDTAASVGVAVDERCDPAKAIPGGARYLLQMYEQFEDWPLALAAYNAGPDRVAACTCVPQITETQNYVRVVTAKWEEHRALYGTGVGPSSAPATGDRATVLQRAQTWIDVGGVPYSMSAYHDGYRADCSGYVSMAWGLAPPGATTVTLRSTHAVPIDRASLQPGDILLDADPGSSGHVVLFERWDADTNFYWGYEQAAGSGGTVYRRIPYPYFDGGADYSPYRSTTLPTGGGL